MVINLISVSTCAKITVYVITLASFPLPFRGDGHADLTQVVTKVRAHGWVRSQIVQ